MDRDKSTNMWSSSSIALPEEVIKHIFTFMAPKDLIQTSLLSKNYRTFWTTNNNNLRFAITNVYSMNLFHQFLLRRRAMNTATILQRVRIQWWPLCESKFINKLIATALIHGVKHLEISLAPRSAEFIVRPHYLTPYTIPPAMLAAPSLETLTLERVWLDGGVPVAWPDLEGLVLVDCGFGGNNGRVVLRGELRRMEVVTYHVPRQVQGDRVEESAVVEMETPRVEFVSYSYQYGSIKCWFGRVEAWDGDVDVDEWFDTCRIWSRVQQGCCGSQAPLELAHHVRVVADGTFHVLEGTISTLASLLKAYGKRISDEAEEAAAAEEDEAVLRRRQRRRSEDEMDGSYGDGGGEVSGSGAENGAAEAKKPKEKKLKKPRVTVPEVAMRIDSPDLAAFLLDISGSYESQEDIQLMRFADYFARVFSSVTAAQFPWTKMFKEFRVAKIAEIPVCYLPEPVYKTSVDWISKRSSESLGSFVVWLLDGILADLANQQASAKGSKKVTQHAPSKAQGSYESQEDIQLMRFADYFARVFSSVTAAQFPWTKMFKEFRVAKIAEVSFALLLSLSLELVRTL
ncbi:hypothetical protein Syun_022046 [Stephania yunnanensis]|uniref:F-box domain-containing protein n=1 Tax=Stephania yunnanensis TaxID=152371 RepID=A0AAP0IGR3_9MAGN